MAGRISARDLHQMAVYLRAKKVGLDSAEANNQKTTFMTPAIFDLGLLSQLREPGRAKFGHRRFQWLGIIGSTRHLIEVLDFCTDEGLNIKILYPVFYSILNSTRIVEDLENSPDFSPDDAPITLIALHFLSIDITSPFLPLDILPDLWATMWPWIRLIDSYWDSLPTLHEWFPSIQIYTDHISLFARLLSEEGTPSLHATPGVHLVIVRVWTILLKNEDCFRDPGFRLVCPLLEGLGVFHPVHLAEVLDGVGTVHELVTENTAHLLQPIFGLLYLHEMKDGGDPDWDALLAAIIGCTTAGIASGPVVQYLVEFIDRTLCPYTVYYSVLKHMRPALERDGKRPARPKISTVFPHWEKFVSAAQLHIRGLEVYELNGITSYNKKNSNAARPVSRLITAPRNVGLWIGTHMAIALHAEVSHPTDIALALQVQFMQENPNELSVTRLHESNTSNTTGFPTMAELKTPSEIPELDLFGNGILGSLSLSDPAMPRNAKRRRWILKYIGDKYARHSLDSTMGATHMQGADKWYVSQRVALDTSEAMSSREVQVGAHVDRLRERSGDVEAVSDPRWGMVRGHGMVVGGKKVCCRARTSENERGRELPKLTWKHLLNKEMLSHELKGEMSKTTAVTDISMAKYLSLHPPILQRTFSLPPFEMGATPNQERLS
ncbi:hypothetical protein B0H17DRAFT_1147707 [Mycena rosella]|uniref:Uncharacterized protein n=1 Tax=Mycena rosella TaxID=1033263 RepID=A0AAD7CHS4_MYCRO|nr:hypothetical protein B0H17DRAFT_1147707 [Mycena rosella]